MAKAKRPQLPLITRFLFLCVRQLTDLSTRRDGTVNRRLLWFFEKSLLGVPPSSKPRRGVKSADVTVDAERKLWIRLFVPTVAADQDRLPVVVFFHGGGFVFLAANFKHYDTVCRRIARKISAVVVSVNYRLAPEHPYPAQFDDGFDVLKFLDENSNVLPDNADLSRCFLAGDSAGGNLAHHVTKRCCESHNHQFSRLQILGVMAVQPFFGGEERLKSELELAKVDPLISVKRADRMWKSFIPPGSGFNRDHEVINVSGPKACDISGLDFPATMVVVGGFDSLKDWQKRYYEWLRESGKETYWIEYPNMVHAFYLFPELPESGQLIDEMKKFIHDKIAKLKA